MYQHSHTKKNIKYKKQIRLELHENLLTTENLFRLSHDIRKT